MAQHISSDDAAPATRRSFLREPFAAASHLSGAGLSIAGLVILIVASAGKPWSVVAVSLYGASMILLYLSSGIYHSLPLNAAKGNPLARLDHGAIFCLIAGTYTPVCLVTLRGPLGWSMFGIEWGLALFGIVASTGRRVLPDAVRVALYITMGWLAVINLGVLRHALSPAAVWWLLAGGIAYTVGAGVYATNRPNLWPGKFNAHDLWHVFVLAGSACHYLFILRYVVAR